MTLLKPCVAHVIIVTRMPNGTQCQWEDSSPFPTADEAAYPGLLCKRFMSILLQYVVNLGATHTDTMQKQLENSRTTSHRWVLDMLPKGKKLKPLVCEFQFYKQFLNNMHSEPEQSNFFVMQLKGARLVQRQIQWGFLRVTEQNGNKLASWTADDKTLQLDGYAKDLEDSEMDQPIQAELCTIGIPRDPWDFLQRAVEVGHPRSMAIHLSQGVTEMLTDNFRKTSFCWSNKGRLT